jgi:hypothetical protein
LKDCDFGKLVKNEKKLGRKLTINRGENEKNCGEK